MEASRVTDFLEVLRTRMTQVRASNTELFFRCLSCMEVGNRQEVYWAGRLVFCRQASDIQIYDACFSSFFADESLLAHRLVEPVMPPEQVEDQEDGLAEPDRLAQQGETRLIARAAERERLRQADFATLSVEQRERVYAWIAALRANPPLRLSRRCSAARKGVLHIGRTARSALQWLGEVGDLRYAAPRFRKRRCVLLLDISGSMKDYAEPLSLYGYSLLTALPEVAEVFVMGTRLTRLTDVLRGITPGAARHKAAESIRDWQGGTRLGASLKQFTDEWGPRGLVRGAVLIIASDGWESGESHRLAEQMERLHRLSHRLVWLNPHKSSPGYEPLAAGMKAALPYVDAFVGGASLQELQALNETIQTLSAGRSRASVAREY